MTTPQSTESFARRTLLQFEGILNKIFGNDLNPFYYLGALGFYFFWIIVVSGAYIYIFYETGKDVSFASVEYITNEQWYLGGIMRSLHRYSSDALVLVMVLHLLREYILGRYRGARWFTWVTGVLLIWLIVAAGINGYWMVWDKLAQYSAVATMEWLDWLPIFTEPMAHNFVSNDILNDRFFSLISFAHVTFPLLVLFFLWIHIQRISYPVVNPRRALRYGMLLAMLALALIAPILSQGQADMGIELDKIDLDWFYLFIYPLLDSWTAGQVWAFVVAVSLLITVVPWLPTRFKQIPIAEVNLKDCSGCRLCVADCPYEAVVMRPRSDGMNFREEAVVVPDRCVSCGICAGACPSATPFRSEDEYISGIEMPSLPIFALRTAMMNEVAKLEGDQRVIVFGCDNAADVGKLRSKGVAALSFPCTAMLPPSFIEYVLNEHHVDGVFVTGCRENDCYHRMGGIWTERRLAAKREPRLRSRAERERIGQFWAASVDFGALESELETFRNRLRGLSEHKDEHTEQPEKAD